MTSASKTTPLNAWHRSQNANMADFGGYDMPLWYSSVKDEHLAVIGAAGVFDTSHMAAVAVSGPWGGRSAPMLFYQQSGCLRGSVQKAVGPGALCLRRLFQMKGDLPSMTPSSFVRGREKLYGGGQCRHGGHGCRII